jgi:hypothetical protein
VGSSCESDVAFCGPLGCQNVNLQVLGLAEELVDHCADDVCGGVQSEVELGCVNDDAMMEG